MRKNEAYSIIVASYAFISFILSLTSAFIATFFFIVDSDLTTFFKSETSAYLFVIVGFLCSVISAKILYKIRRKMDFFQELLLLTILLSINIFYINTSTKMSFFENILFIVWSLSSLAIVKLKLNTEN